MVRRTYLDFDGVVSPIVPGVEHGTLLDVNGDAVSVDFVYELGNIPNFPDLEVIWATHREEAVYDVTDSLGLPRSPHLTFTDPTGSKVKDILAHYTENPCDYAAVNDDSLTSTEIEALNAAGLTVRLFDNSIYQSTHGPEGKQ